MMHEILPRAADVARNCKLSEAACPLLARDSSPLQFFTQLDRARLYRDGVRFAAHWLPPREAVWWGCLCLWHSYRPEPPTQEKSAMQAVVSWLQDPHEEQRRAAEAAAQAAGFETPAGGLALAVYCSGGSLSGPGLPAVAPAPSLLAKTISGAVLAASRNDAECLRQFMMFAADVATGRSPCPAPPTFAPARP